VVEGFHDARRTTRGVGQSDLTVVRRQNPPCSMRSGVTRHLCRNLGPTLAPGLSQPWSVELWPAQSRWPRCSLPILRCESTHGRGNEWRAQSDLIDLPSSRSPAGGVRKKDSLTTSIAGVAFLGVTDHQGQTSLIILLSNMSRNQKSPAASFPSSSHLSLLSPSCIPTPSGCDPSQIRS